MGHREALVFLAGTGRAFTEILLALVEGEFLAAVDTHVFPGPTFWPAVYVFCSVRLITRLHFYVNNIYQLCSYTLVRCPADVSAVLFLNAKLYCVFFPNAGMSKKIIGLLGSPLPEGNTAQLLARALREQRTPAALSS